MTFPRLLAKSVSDPLRPTDEATLLGHITSVVAAARELLELRAQAAVRAMGLSDGEVDRVRRIVLLAAFQHDLGKCTDHFQAMVRRQRVVPQLIRHEAATLWLTAPGQPLADWLRAAVSSECEYAIACLAAAGHHRKFAAAAIATEDAGAGRTAVLLAGHDDFASTLAFGIEALGIGPSPNIDDITVEDSRRTPMRHQLEDWENALGIAFAHDHDRRILALVKAMVLAADVAGSALPKAGEEISRWIPTQLGNRANREGLRNLIALRLDGKPLRAFQSAIASSAAPVTIVRAGCGSGKTAAAYAWAAEQHAGRQLWVTYPTTGTSTEGYRDYVAPAELGGRLEHSRASVDLEILGLAEGDENTPRDHDRLEALRTWGAEVVVATADTVLGLIQCQRKGMYAFPALVEAAVVFDEIHAYDEKMFGLLLRFLDGFPGTPVLLMTASLPRHRLAALQTCVGAHHHCCLEIIEGPSDLQELPRYRRETCSDPVAACATVVAAGGKVLWVSNTVSRAMSAAERARSSLGGEVPVHLYHSRFRYLDRVQHHREVIQMFGLEGPAVACTTQVAEMSLDLSADLLISDIAPISATIQRLGRLNRRSTPSSAQPVRSFHILEPQRPAPYTEDQLADTRRWLSVFAGRPLSQQDLVDAWERMDSGEQPIETEFSSLFDGGFDTKPLSVRKASPSLTVLLSQDAKDVAAGRLRSMDVALPMPPAPKGVMWQRWPRTAYLPVPPPEVISYDPRLGGQWRKPDDTR